MAEPADHAIRRAKMNAPWDGRSRGARGWSCRGTLPPAEV